MSKYVGAFHSALALEQHLQRTSVRKPFYALVARSNAGKSSLVNALLGGNSNNLAHVSQVPGKTKAAQLFDCNDKCLLIDLPGYGWSSAGDKQDMDRILLECLQLQYSYSSTSPPPSPPTRLHVLRLVDANRALQSYPQFELKDDKLISFLHEKSIPHTNVITKMDALSRPDQIRLRALLPRDVYPWLVSSRTRQNIAQLRQHLCVSGS